jgi:putative DNA primase/helicase
MAGIGSVDRPLVSDEPMSVARAFVDDVGMVKGSRALWLVGGSWWVWSGGRWKVRTNEQMDRELWRWMDGRWYGVMGKDGSVLRKLVPRTSTVMDVMRALQAVCEARWERTPLWVGVEGPDPRTCVAFEDVVVQVTKEGVKVVAERDEKWLDSMVVPVMWDEKAECPRWMQALDEWSRGDEKWKKLLQWWMGYCLMSKRSYAKWLLMQGKSRAGKGVIADVLRAMLGWESWFETGMGELGGEFGLDGIEYARVMSISEFHEVDSALGAKVTRVLKNIVGEDGVTVNAKYEKARRVKVGAAPMVQSNLMPKLPNEGGGIGTKMLVLPFTVSFREGDGTFLPDFGLRDKLRAEMAGIARWALQGAVELEAAGGLGWPEPDAAERIRTGFRIKNNPLDAFLEARFVRKEDGFVTSEALWGEWVKWKKENEVKMQIGRNFLALRLEEESTWKIERSRKRIVVDGEEQQVRGMRGLGIRREQCDEV